MAYATDGTVGVDFSTTTAGTTTDGENALFSLGTRVTGTDGTSWVYVQASAAITQYDAVAITENFQATPLTKALADAGHMVGFAQVAFSDNDLGWVAVNGTNITCRVAGSCAADVQLYTTGNAGILDDTSASQTLIRGVVAVTANSTSAASTSEVIATYPSGTATP